MTEAAPNIVNMVRAQANHVPESGLPLDAFPAKVQEIILDLASEESFSVEYAAFAMLSAVATAIGNSHHIRIKGAWTSSPCLYIILVGHPGQGKTPPLDFAYKPIQDYDYSLFCKFKEDYECYTARQSEKAKDDTLDVAEKPVLIQTILSDFTPEVMMKQHNDNQRGIVILVDEIMGMFNSINRYNDNPLITQLLTAYSGKQLKVSRCNNPIPAIIRNPCISIIGTTQTQRIAEFFTKENVSSGLVDRFLFVFPKEQRPPIWTSENDSIGIPTMTKPSTALRWKEIIDKLLLLEFPMAEDGKSLAPIVLGFSDNARTLFYDWRNSICEAAFAIEGDAGIDSRIMKMDSNVGRLSLVFQLLKWACGKSHKQYIDAVSVRSAIRIHQYLEECYGRIMAIVKEDNIDAQKREFLSLLGDSFTTAEAIVAGKETGFSESGVKKCLPKLVRDKVICKVAHGQYAKVHSSTLCTLSTLGTFTLSGQDNPVQSSQSTHNTIVPKCHENISMDNDGNDDDVNSKDNTNNNDKLNS